MYAIGVPSFVIPVVECTTVFATRENYPLSVLPDAQSRFAMLFICFAICYSRKRIIRHVASSPSIRNLSRFRADDRIGRSTPIIHLDRPQRLRGKNISF